MKLQGAKGGKGKSQSASVRTPKESPNTLTSASKGRILDLLVHGPIVGLADGLKSVYLDGVAVLNEDGTSNFDGIQITTREGYPDQPPIPGFRAAENVVDVSSELKYGFPVSRAISNNDADAVVVTVQVDSLLRQDKKTGDILPFNVEIDIETKGAGGAWVNRVRDGIGGKTTSPYQRSYRIDLEGFGPWEIRVTRKSADDKDSSTRSPTRWISMTEVVDARLSYPDSALVGIEVDAQYFGSSVPARSYDVKLSIIKVPSNYNPETRKYTGIWNGAFKLAWTDNPAWVFYDLATNPVIGAGLQNVDKWELYRIAQYCDELVPDGYGKMEPRFTANVLFADRQEALTTLATLASVFRGMVYWGTNTVVPVADMPTDPVKLVTPANVIDGEFEYVGTSLKERHSVALVMWSDPADGHKLKPEVVEDPDSVELFGWKETQVTAFACSSRGQAHRLGKWLLYSERNETQTITYRASVDHADLRPGDVIQVVDPSLAGARLGGRVAVTGQSELTLDQVPAEVGTERWHLGVLLPTGSIERREITRFEGNKVVLKNPLSQAPVVGAVWVLSAQSVTPPLFRVASVDEDGEESATYKITATEYSANKYANVELDRDLPEPSASLLPTGPVAAPMDITVEPFTYIAGGTEHQAMSVSWTAGKDARITSYVAEVKSPTDVEFRTAYVGGEISFDLRDVIAGEWQIRLKSMTVLGVSSPWIGRTFNVAQLLLPTKPDSVAVEVGTFSVAIRPKSSYPGAVYEFWRSLVAVDMDLVEDNANLLTTASNLVDANLTPDTEYFYYIRGANRYGTSDWYPVGIRTDNDPEIILQVLSDRIRETHLYQALRERIGLIDADADTPGSVTQRIEEANEAIRQRIDGVAQRIDELASAPDYKPEITYEAGAVVKRQGRLYQAQAQTSGVAPPAPVWKDLGAFVSLGQFAGGLAVGLSEVQNQVQTTSEGVDALSTKLDGVFAKISPVMAGSTIPAGSSGVFAGAWSESYARANDKEAMAKRVDSVASELADASALLAEEQATRAANDQAVAYHLRALTAELEGGKSLIMQESVARSEADDFLASQVTSMRTQLTDQFSAALQNESSVRASADGAIATAVEKLQTTVGENTASIQSASQVINGLSASYNLKLDVNGYVAGYGLYNDGEVSEFAIRADRFYIADPTSEEEVLPFILEGGKVYMNTTLIKDATIAGAKIADGTIDSAKIGNVIQSTAKNLQGDPMWILSKDGYFRFNSTPGIQSRIEFTDSNGVVRLQIGEYNG